MAEATSKHVERDLPVRLEDVDMKAKGQELAELELSHARKKQEGSDIAAKYRVELKDMRAKITDLSKQIDGGFMTVPVPCSEINNWPTNVTVVRLDGRDLEGNKLPAGSPPAVVEERPIETEEVVAPKGRKKGRKKGGAAAPAPEGAAPEGESAGATPPPEDSRTLTLFDEQALAGGTPGEQAQAALGEAPVEGEAPPPAEGDASAEATSTGTRRRRRLQPADPAAAS